MPGGLVEVRVDAHHEIHPGQGSVESVSVRCGQNWVSRDGDHGLDLAVAGGLDLLGQHRGG